MPAPIEVAGPEPAPGPPPVPPAPPGPGRLLLFAAGAGLLAGLVAWVVGEATLPVFLPTWGQIPSESLVPHSSYYEHADADYKNAIIAYTLLGGMLGLELGLAGGLARRSTAAATRTGAMGVVLGGLLAAGAAAVILPVYFREHDLNPKRLSDDLLLPLLVHAGCWAAAGLGGGLAWGLGSDPGDRSDPGRLVRAGLGGLLGAIGGAVVYEMTAALCFPSDRSGEPISRTTATRCLARVAVGVGAALAAAALAEARPKRAAAPAPTASA